MKSEKVAGMLLAGLVVLLSSPVYVAFSPNIKSNPSVPSRFTLKALKTDHDALNPPTPSNGGAGDQQSYRRRSLFQFPLQLGITFLLTQHGHPQLANAAMEKGGTTFQTGQKLTVEQAKERFREGRKSIQYLLDHYDEICEGGGDNVRRYLGTVGTTSGMFGISKVLKTLVEEADDLVEFTELANEVEKSIQQADGSAYMAIFVTTSTSYTPPAKYFGDAKIEVKRCLKAMDELAEMIHLENS